MENKKQTAVEWLMENLHLAKSPFEQALAMEKEQIERAFRDGFFDGCNPLIFKIDDEQYYKEKYESKTNI